MTRVNSPRIMLIGVHAKALSERNPTGVAQYARQLLTHMAALPEATRHRFLFYVDKATTDDRRPTTYDVGITTNDKSLTITDKRILRSPIMWTQVRLAWELALGKPDIFFTPQHVLPLTAPKRSVVTVHGLEYEKFPQYYPLAERLYLRWVTKDAVRRAAHIIAVSEATKRDLMELYQVPEGKITVVHHGIAAQEISNDKYQISNKTDGPFFLYIGRIEKKKNVDGIIRAFAMAKEKYKIPHKLILAGSDGFGSEFIKLQATRYKIQNDIKFAGYVNDIEKQELLEKATAFVFPSWYEGFGLPILEAQVAGVPVITSNTSSMPEVGGKGAFYVDPAEPESIAAAMQKIANDDLLRKELIAHGLENIKRFSWEKCAKETMAVFEKVRKQ